VWGIMGAHNVAAPHRRDRIWIVANSDRQRRAGRGVCRHGEIKETPTGSLYTSASRSSEEWREDLANPDSTRPAQQKRSKQKLGHWLIDGSEDVPDSNEDGRGGVLREAGQGEDFEELRNDANWKSPEARGDWSPCREIPDSESQRRKKEPSTSYRLDTEESELGASDAWGINSQPGKPWEPEPLLGRVAHGVANRLQRLEAIGDGQVPAVAASIWRILSKEFDQ